MIPTPKLAQMMGQSIFRCIERYEKETGKRASKILIELTDTADWKKGRFIGHSR